jgi:hypothetical protein
VLFIHGFYFSRHPKENGRFPPSFLPIAKALQHSEHEKKVAKVEQEGKGSTLNILP